LTPLSHWIWFHVAILLLMALEYLLHLAFPDTRKKAIYATMLWTAAALALAAVLIPHYKAAGATQFLAGYALEQALSVDNLFVFLLLFNLFRIAPARQPRVLFWGVFGAIVLRGAFIAGGLGLLNHFHWIEYVFAAVLLIAAMRLLKPITPATGDSTPENIPGWLSWLSSLRPLSANQDHFLVKESPVPGEPARWMATTLLLALIAVELTDVAFALDSIPAVLSITRQPFLAYASNIMAVMCLRSLYVLLTMMLSQLRFIHLGLAALLAFAALKMLLSDWWTISPIASLGIIAAVLTITILASIAAKPKPAIS
jgi:tellurite resistance protein TerC